MSTHRTRLRRTSAVESISITETGTRRGVAHPGVVRRVRVSRGVEQIQIQGVGSRSRSRGGEQIQGCGADPGVRRRSRGAAQIQGWGADPGVGADPGWEQIQGCGADPGVGRRSKGRGRVRSKGRSGADPGVWWQTQEADPDDKVDEGHLGVRVHHRDLAQDVQIQRERWLPRSLPRDTLRIEDLATNSQSSRGVRGHGHFCAQERNDGRALARPGIDRCHAAPSHSVAQQDERSADRPWRVQ